MAIESIELKEFSEYRSELMGIAIILIMASHTLGGFAVYGIVGVEWFLILSAIGQWYSLEKESCVFKYYKRRMIRILPTYLIVSIPYFIIKYPLLSFKEFCIRISGINFFVNGDKTFWFVYLILICYLVSPIYYSLIKTQRYSIAVPFVLVLIIFILSKYIPRTEILVTRIPIYLLGMNLAQYVYEEMIIANSGIIRRCVLCSVLAVLLLLIIYIDTVGIEVVRLVYFICGVPTLFFALTVIKHFPVINKFLAFFGGLTYELYLIHQPVALALCRKLPLSAVSVIIISYLLALILAYLLHSVICLLMERYNNRFQHSI